MAAAFLTKPTRSFGNVPDDDVMVRHLTAAGCSIDGLHAAVGAGLTWVEILSLVFNYGPLVTTILNETIAALRSTGGLTIGLINQLVARYGPKVHQMITDLLAKLGIALPT